MKIFLTATLLLSVLTYSGFALAGLRIISDPHDSLGKVTYEADTSSSAQGGLTAQEIIGNYLEAIGGKANLEKVIDRITVMRSIVNGKSLTITIYQKAPDMMRQVIDQGTFKQNVYFNGVKGAMVVAGKSFDVKGSELEKLKYESMLHFLTNLDSLGIKLQLQGTSVVNGNETYQVAVVLPSGSKWIQSFDKKTWLKVEETKDVVVTQGTFVQKTYYSDYHDVDGMKYPFDIKQELGRQQIEFKVESIRVNSGLGDSLFNKN